jgi:hypothetical protein
MASSKLSSFSLLGRGGAGFGFGFAFRIRPGVSSGSTWTGAFTTGGAGEGGSGGGGSGASVFSGGGAGLGREGFDLAEGAEGAATSSIAMTWGIGMTDRDGAMAKAAMTEP